MKKRTDEQTSPQKPHGGVQGKGGFPPRRQNFVRGVELTSGVFFERLEKEEIRISMDGKGRWRDSVFVERIWRSIKYEEVCHHAYAPACEARQSIGRYIGFYNTIQPHFSLKAQTLDQVQFNRMLESMAA